MTHLGLQNVLFFTYPNLHQTPSKFPSTPGQFLKNPEMCHVCFHHFFMSLVSVLITLPDTQIDSNTP